MKKVLLFALGAVISLSDASAQSEGFTFSCRKDSSFSNLLKTARTTSVSCPPSSSAFVGIYKQNVTYMPNNTSINPLATTKKVKIVLNVINPAVDGAPYVNYHASDETFLRSVFDRVNYFLANNASPTDPVTIAGRSGTVIDTRFRVEIAEIRYLNVDLSLHSYDAYMFQPEKYLNVFLTYDDSGSPIVRGVAGGVAVPSQANPSADDLLTGYHDGNSLINLAGIYQSTSWRSSTDKIAQLFLHQLGHCLGLQHTYAKENGAPRPDLQEVNNEAFYDYLADVFNVAASGSKFYPRPNDITDCTTYLLANSNHNDNLINNIMSGNPEGLSFTHIQLGRMHRNAHFLSIRNNIYVQDPEDATYSRTHEGQMNPWNITSNQTWDFDIKMYSDIVVKAGNTLTISCTVRMPFHSMIYVEQGAKLVIDGGTITSERNNLKWRGIHVYGTETQPQSATSYQGVVELKNGATIENALNGVTIGGGAILRCSNAHFLNNRKGLQFWKFVNKSYPASPTELNNLSYVNNTDFIVDDNYYAEGTTNYKIQEGISLWEVKGISILGCRFENQMSDSKKAIYGSGTGILTDRGDITVSNYCVSSGGGSTYPCTTTIPSWFKGFRFGICVANVEKAAKTVRVSNTSFEHNLYGVYDKGTNMIDVNRSTFDLYNYSDEGSSPLTSVGVYITGATGYHVEGNNFNGHTYGTTPVSYSPYPYYHSFNHVGTYCKNTGSDNNKIYRNYYNLSTYGIVADGVNRGFASSSTPEEAVTGLQYVCNNFGINLNDVGNWAGMSPDAGIRLYQGYKTMPAGNTLLSNPPVANVSWMKNYSVETSSTPLTKYYWYQYSPASEMPVRYTGITTLVGIPHQNPCYSSYSGGPVTAYYTGRETATTTFSALLAAMDDTSAVRNITLHSLYSGMSSPYGNLENTLLYLEEGNELAAMNTYGSIGQSYPMTATEAQEFVLGKTLINMIAQHYRDSISFDSLTAIDQDSLRYIIANGTMWAKVRACNWLSRVTGEVCDELVYIPVDSTIDTTGSELARVGLGNGSDMISISPNPSTNDFRISYNVASSSLEARIVINDVLGRMVMERILPPTKNVMLLDASNWAPGVYLYKVIYGSKMVNYGKLVKQ